MSWRRAFITFALAVACLALLDGAALTLQSGYALSAFSAQRHVAGIVGVGLFRVHAAHIPVVAACLAVVIRTHERPLIAASTPLPVGAWIIFASVVPAAAGAAAIALLSAADTAAVVFDLGWPEFIVGLRELVRIGDAAYGLARACVCMPYCCL